MSVTKLVIGLGVVVFGLLCWMAVDGITAAAVTLITIGALVVLVGGGNWIGGRSSPHGPSAGRVRPAVVDVRAAGRAIGRRPGRPDGRPARRPPGRDAGGAGGPVAVSLFRDNGVVLRTYRLGEADRIVVFLTEHHGKVRAVAKGVRRTASKFGGRLEPLSHVRALAWQGRSDLDIVNQVEVIDHFRGIREDLDRVAKALSLVEVADQLAQERHPDPRLYEMLVGALRTLADPARDPRLGRAGVLHESARPRRGRPAPHRLRVLW